MRLSDKVKYLEYYQSELNSFYDKSKPIKDIVNETISYLAEAISHDLKEHELKDIYDTIKGSKIHRRIKNDL